MEQKERILTVKQTLVRHGMTPNKALGQNFLLDPAAIEKIAQAANPAGRTVVEIGPGLGALTKQLLAAAERVIAIEKDAAMAAALMEELPDPKLTVVTGDFLQADVAALTEGKPFAAAGNLPYYVTTPIAERLLCQRPLSISILVQREAAERFFACPGDRVYGPVAAVAQSLYTPSRVAEVNRDRFWPQPEVDSSAVALTPLQGQTADPAKLLKFLKRCFSMRRKTLKNNLPDAPGLPEALEQLGVAQNVRGESLSPAALLTLYEILEGENQG